MNHFFSLHRTKFSAILIALSLSIFLASCKTESDPKDFLPLGKWQDSFGSIYEISQTEFSNYSETYDSYAGNNLVISKSTDNSGYIYIQYTKAYCKQHSNYDNDAPDIGKWYAISFKELTNSSIQISGAYKDGGETSTETLEKAMAEFKIENGYFSTYSECLKISD